MNAFKAITTHGVSEHRSLKAARDFVAKQEGACQVKIYLEGWPILTEYWELGKRVGRSTSDGSMPEPE